MNFYDKTGFSQIQTKNHYKGMEDNLSYEEDVFSSITYREIIQVLHVHAFMIPLIIFVLSRILSMTGIGEGIKITVYVSAFIGAVLYLSGPYLISFKSDIFTISLIASYVILGACFITFISLPLYKMWSRKSVEEADYWL